MNLAAKNRELILKSRHFVKKLRGFLSNDGKVVVKGAEKCNLYAWLTDKSKNGWNDKEPSWNFCKYVINEKGELVNFFASGVKPTSPEFIAALNK